jgi:superfamily II DNA or RNA helicase
VIKLRPYQEECLKAINTAFENGIARQLVHLATAAGKTVIFAHLIQQKCCRTLVLAHTLELLEQARDKIQMICPSLDVGLVNAHNKEFNKSIVVSTIQSARQADNLKHLQDQDFELCIYDECHRSASESSRSVLDALDFGKGTKRLLAGFSSTPYRNDSRGLGEVFDEVVYHKSIKDLIEVGYLCQPKGIKIKTDLDLATIKSESGDFVTEALSDYMNTPEMNDLVVNTFIEHAKNRKTVCFAVTVDHANRLSEAFRDRGITSETIHGGTPKNERKALLERFKNGEILVLTNCQLLTEGWDCPDVSCVLVARPTQSKSLFVQMAGRGLRLFPNKKDCLILDFGSKTHSLCGMASLVGDTEEEERKERTEGKMSEFAKELPRTINKKLRAAIEEFDLLGDAFTWIKDGPSYSLKAIGNKVLKIFPTAEGRFSVVFFDGNNPQTIARDLSFEYAFASAEEYAKENRPIFVVSDIEATWRTLPISGKQKDVFRSYGYRAGIGELSRGQAALIISSGVLNKKAIRR